MTDKESLAESIRNYLESGADLLLTDDDYRTIIEALEQEPKTDILDKLDVIITDALDKSRDKKRKSNEMAIKVLKKQEPKTDLDKIRAEIQSASMGKWYTGRVDGKTDEVVLMDDVIGIIDKYRGEG